jgi:alkanesulfonate monooxygenase SsuD/methylene tetrahydromethanopterin reductase-like flavin-dependent oxidoreductase (luciferase family)
MPGGPGVRSVVAMDPAADPAANPPPAARPFEVGVVLPVGGRPPLAEAARLAEAAGLDSVWVGDHLATGAPSLDNPVALATAAAVTDRVRIGAGVFVPGLRPLAWAAKQVASLQVVSGGRLVLGVGSGGGAAQWAAAGVPFDRRGPRTDTALRLLPDLLAGRPTVLPDEPGRPTVELAPAVEVPPIWVGNAGPVALRRAATSADGWFPSLIGPADVEAGARRLVELAAEAGRPTPTIAIGATGALGDGPGVPTRSALAGQIAAVYGRPVDEVAAVPLTGSPADAAEALDAYRRAGATHAVVGLAGPDWPAQVALLAETRRLLPTP